MIKFASFLGYLSTLLILTPVTTLAQSDPPEVDPIREVQVGNCQGTNEVRFHSQKLRSPDGKRTIYYDATLRRIGKRGDYVDSVGGCFPLGVWQTPKTEMVIESSTATKRIGLSSENDAFIVMQPRSFSPDGRYLIVSVDIGYEGGDGGSDILFLDSQNRYQSLSIYDCQSPISHEYKGFISASEILIECDAQYQVVNLNRRSVRKVSEQFFNSANLQSYGTVLAPLTIVKKQMFTRQ